MSKAEFDILSDAFKAQQWQLDMSQASKLAPHLKASLSSCAGWAVRFGISTGWFKTNFAKLAAPDYPSPPLDQIEAVIAACRANGEASRYGATYVELLLRWAWAEEAIELGELEPPYNGIKTILLSGSGISGEHGSIGTGMASIRIGSPSNHL